MSPRKLLAGATAVGLVACVSGAAVAAGASAPTTTIKAVSGPPVVKVNRYIQDGLRWDKDSYVVKSGGKLRIVNDAADEGPHTFTVVEQKDLPTTGPQVANCAICNKLGKAHGADPSSDKPPKFPFLENGVGTKKSPKVDRPGDSGLTGSGKKGESVTLTVTAKKGAVLHFICLVHPWMQATVKVS
jgi:hypothetical protein